MAESNLPELTDEQKAVCLRDATREAVDHARQRIHIHPVSLDEAPHLFPEEESECRSIE